MQFGLRNNEYFHETLVVKNEDEKKLTYAYDGDKTIVVVPSDVEAYILRYYDDEKINSLKVCLYVENSIQTLFDDFSIMPGEYKDCITQTYMNYLTKMSDYIRS